MDELEKDRIITSLAKQLEEYIKAIIEKYGKYIPKEKLDRLKSITDFKSIIKLDDYGSVSAYANENEITLPLHADKILKDFSKMPEYGSDKEHKMFDSDTLILNNNTYSDYVFHLLVSGATAQDYFEDVLLHETMHFCGSWGYFAFNEGLNELLSRKLALEKGYKSTACAYSKEMEVALELQSVFGEEIMNQIAFIRSERQIYIFLVDTLGIDEAKLYLDVSRAMQKEFTDKFFTGKDAYKGFNGVLEKSKDYSTLDYSNVYEMINEYKLSHQKKEEDKKDK